MIRRAFRAVARLGYNYAAFIALGEFRARPYRLYADSELGGRYRELGEAVSVARDMQAMEDDGDVELYRAKPQIVTVEFERVEFGRGESE